MGELGWWPSHRNRSDPCSYTLTLHINPSAGEKSAKKNLSPNALVVSTQTLRIQTDSGSVGGRICSRIRHLTLYSTGGRWAGQKKFRAHGNILSKFYLAATLTVNEPRKLVTRVKVSMVSLRRIRHGSLTSSTQSNSYWLQALDFS